MDATEFLRESADVYSYLEENEAAVLTEPYQVCAKATFHVASPTGLFGFTRLTAYSTSKGGVIGLMRAMAADYAPNHIRVNAIIPGTIDTPMNAVELSDPAARASCHWHLIVHLTRYSGAMPKSVRPPQIGRRAPAARHASP